MRIMKMNSLQIVMSLLLISSRMCHLCLTPQQHQMSALDPRTQSYCGSTINWNISPTTLDIHAQYDSNALAQYQQVYYRWQQSGGSNNKDPTNDCLGVLRNILCAYNYPICSEDKGDRVRVCTWYCDYLSDRCPKETDLFNLVCKTSADTDCAVASRLILNILILAIALFLFI